MPHLDTTVNNIGTSKGTRARQISRLALTQAQMAELFNSSKSNLSEQIKHIFEKGELDEDSVVRKIRTTAADSKHYLAAHYNLNMIISLRYRVKVKDGTPFRRWATEQLKEYLVKVFTLNDQQPKNSVVVTTGVSCLSVFAISTHQRR